MRPANFAYSYDVLKSRTDQHQFILNSIEHTIVYDCIQWYFSVTGADINWVGLHDTLYLNNNAPGYGFAVSTVKHISKWCTWI